MGYFKIFRFLCRKIGTMSKYMPYKDQELAKEKVCESIVFYTTNNKENLDIVIGKRDDIEDAISSEELLSKLRPRIKAFFE